MRLTMQQRQAVVAKTASRYQRSSKKEKGSILSELVEVTEYSRVYARRVLRQHGQRINQGKHLLLADVRVHSPCAFFSNPEWTLGRDAVMIVGVNGVGKTTTIGKLAQLRSIEGRYQAQLVQDKARQIELYGQRYRDVVTGLARAFEIAGGIQDFDDRGYDQRLQKTLQEDPNLIALALWPVGGKPHRAFQSNVIRLDEVDARVSEVLAHMNGRGVAGGCRTMTSR